MKILAAVLWLRFTTPAYDAVPGTCAESATPTDRLASVQLLVDMADGPAWDFGSHPAAAPGARDSFRLVLMPRMRRAWVVVADSAGNVSCESNSVWFDVTAVPGGPPAEPWRPPSPEEWLDVSGRRVRPEEMAPDGRPRAQGLYFVARSVYLDLRYRRSVRRVAVVR